MVDDSSTEALIQRLQEESRKCTFPTDGAGVKKRYKDTALVLFKEDLDDGVLRNYLSFGTRRSSAVSQYGNTPLVIRRSRSSNGELTTVAEQVATLQGRSTRSNYTLSEAREKENESDSDDNVFHESRFNSDESFANRENNGKDSKVTTDSNESVQRDEEAPPDSTTGPRSPTCPQEIPSTIWEEQKQNHDNKKSFSHYDTPVQHSSDSVERDVTQPLEQDNSHDKRNISKESRNILNEVLEASTPDESLQATSELLKDNIIISSKHNFLPETPDDTDSQSILENKDINQTSSQNTCDPSLPTTSDQVHDTRSNPEVDHEAILREYVQQPLRQNKSLLQDNDEHNLSAPHTPNTKQKEDFNITELRIVESTDSLFDEAARETGASACQKTLTTSDIPHLSDDSDVVFIDAGSPSLSRVKLSCEACSGSTEEVLHNQEEGTNNLQEITHSPETPITISPKVPESDAKPENDEFKEKELTTRRRHDSHNSFRDLPIRSPTPPRRRPQRSPQTPKLREKTRHRNSSLALTSDEETQELLANGTRSASPTSKTKDFRFFSFSLKKEKSKSSTSLGSKRKKERVRLTSVKLSLEDPGAVNPKLVLPNPTEGSRLDHSGKRVGVRSMMIDGTIKRNFIVIHPSDDSDTIGLAPMSHQAPQREVMSTATPEALSTVKTHITTLNTEKLEAMKRISCQGGLKEELSNIPENLRDESKESIRGTISVSSASKSLRIKQTKKSREHLPLRTSHSVSSESVSPSPSNSQIVYKSPSSLSRVDCDSPTASAHTLNYTEVSRTVSKLCVVM